MCTTRSSSRLLGVSASVHAGIPPRPDPSTSPLGVGLETPQGQTPQLPPWLCTWRPARHAGIPPAMHAGIPPPLLCTEFLTHATENIILPQTSFAGGKY